MRPARRTFLRVAAGAVGLSIVPRAARSQAYPSRPVRLLVGFAAGSNIDVAARLIAQWLSERLPSPVVVENRPGASGNIAAEAVTRTPADGHTLLMTGTFSSVSAILYEKLNFDFVRDIAPVAGFARTAGVMMVSPSLPASSVPEFIAHAKANPGRLNMAADGPASVSNLYGELFKSMTGVELVTVHYRGSGALIDLLGGQAHVNFSPVAPALEFIRSGRLRGLAVTTTTPCAALPTLPAMEKFVPGYEASGWQGIGAPAGTPPQILALLNRHVNAALADPVFSRRLVDLGLDPFATSPDELGRFIVDYDRKWRKVIKAANIKAE
jgi:tripartite-type tricarboxylate transporter receptor subunit TctC